MLPYYQQNVNDFIRNGPIDNRAHNIQYIFNLKWIISSFAAAEWNWLDYKNPMNAISIVVIPLLVQSINIDLKSNIVLFNINVYFDFHSILMIPLSLLIPPIN